MDHSDGNNRLAKIAKVLARAEAVIAGLALLVLGDGDEPTDAAPIEVIYPTEFDLYTAKDLADSTTSFQALVAGAAPCRSRRACCWAAS